MLFCMDMPPLEWATDEELFASLPGGQAVIDWFGFCPDFHDGTLEKLELCDDNALLGVRAFRMTNQINDEGFYIHDRHAVVTFRLLGVTGLKLEGDASSVILQLSIRRLSATPNQSEWQTCRGPVAGDIEIAFDTSIGLYGSIYAKELVFEIRPWNTIQKE